MRKLLFLSLMLIVGMIACKKEKQTVPSDLLNNGGTTSYPIPPVIQNYQTLYDFIPGNWYLTSIHEIWYVNGIKNTKYQSFNIGDVNATYYEFKIDKTVTIHNSPVGFTNSYNYNFVNNKTLQIGIQTYDYYFNGVITLTRTYTIDGIVHTKKLELFRKK